MAASKTTSASRPFLSRRLGRWQWLIWILLVLVILLLAARLYLPFWLKDYVNEKLNAMDGYRGSVEDIDVQLFRGAYTIKGLDLYKIDKGIPAPFVAIASSDISVQWGALFHGRIVSDIHLTQPVLNFAVSKSGQTSQTGTETNWNPLLDALVPIDINIVEIIRGKVTFKDYSAEPPTDIYIRNVNGALTNLRNVSDEKVALPSGIRFTGTSISDGKLSVNGKLNTLTKYLDMDLDTKLEGAQLSGFNSFTNACCSLNFKAGDTDVYSELTVKNAQLNGYVKLLVRDLSVDRSAEELNALEVIWGNIAAFLIEIFTNQPKDQFATKIPINGSLEDIQTSFWPALGAIFRNAFVQAFKKGTDDEISFGGTKAKAKPPTQGDDHDQPHTNGSGSEAESLRPDQRHPYFSDDHPRRR